MKLYTKKNISSLLQMDRRTVSEYFLLFGILPTEIRGQQRQYCYDIYKVDAFYECLKKIRRHKNISLMFDFVNEEIFTIDESNIKDVHLTCNWY